MKARGTESWIQPRWWAVIFIVFVVLAALLFPVPRAAANNRPPCTWQVLVEDAPLPYRHLADVLAGRPHRHRGSGSVCPAP